MNDVGPLYTECHAKLILGWYNTGLLHDLARVDAFIAQQKLMQRCAKFIILLQTAQLS